MQLRAYRSVDGRPIEGDNVVPMSELSLKLGYNEAGELSFTIPSSRPLALWGARRKLRPWYATVAVFDGDEILHSGPVLRRKWTPRGGLSVTVGGTLDYYSKRLVLPYALDSRWVDGEVLLDEENPAPHWILQFAGQSLGGIGAGLIREAHKWGPLLVDDPATEAGIHVRTYNGWDFAKTSDRLLELGEVLGGPQIDFRSYLRADGYLRARYVASQGGGRHHRLSTVMEGHGATVEDVDEDGASMATEVYALGGREEDIVLAARDRSARLTDQGYPVMQEALKSHSTVSRLDTLKGHVGQATVDGSTVPESTQLKVRRSHGVRPGDVLDISTSSSYHGRVEQALHVVQVSYDLSEWATVSAFPEEV